jgi:Uncharacterised nucleotidyltransferase
MRWEAFNVVCRYLRDGLLEDGPLLDLDKERIRWEPLISVSSQHFVTPALAWCLKDRPELPPHIRAYFEAALSLNLRRNNCLLGALWRVLEALNKIGVEPVLLKGAARLVDETYPSLAVRFLGDIDLLIPVEGLEIAARSLRNIGFESNPNDGIGLHHHHLPTLHERASGVGVELHKDIVPFAFDEILPTAWCCEQTRPFEFRGHQVRLLDWTRAVAHNIVHDQLANHQYQRRGVELRQLLDFALIRNRHSGEIDWREIDRRFSNVSTRPVLAAYLELAEVLLGRQTTDDSLTRASATISRLKQRMGMWHAVRSLTIDYLVARRREPLGVIRLFRPATWSKRIELIKKGLDEAV